MKFDTPISPSNLLTLAAVTAVNRMLCGHPSNDRTLGVSIDTHNRLDDFFGALGIRIAEEPSIPKKVRATLNRMNSDPAEHEALRRLIEQIGDSRYYARQDFEPTIEYLNAALTPDGFELRRVGERYRLVATGLNTSAASKLAAKAKALDLDSVQADFERAIEQAENDPEDAVTSACSLVESVCRCILEAIPCDLPAKLDVQHLADAAGRALGVSPSRTDLPPALAQDLKQILGGLQTIAGGVGALRTHFGDAHGRSKKRTLIDSRIARLAIHSACTISLFYLETWQRRAARNRAPQ